MLLKQLDVDELVGLLNNVDFYTLCKDEHDAIKKIDEEYEEVKEAFNNYLYSKELTDNKEYHVSKSTLLLKQEIKDLMISCVTALRYFGETKEDTINSVIKMIHYHNKKYKFNKENLDTGFIKKVKDKIMVTLIRNKKDNNDDPDPNLILWILTNYDNDRYNREVE